MRRTQEAYRAGMRPGIVHHIGEIAKLLMGLDMSHGAISNWNMLGSIYPALCLVTAALEGVCDHLIQQVREYRVSDTGLSDYRSL